MNKLPKNIDFDRYGLHVRLVNENDASFILKLRTNPKLSRFIHSTDDDIQKQKEWIREYKLREAKGVDYYFIYSKNGIPIGVNRIYDINYNNNTCTGGSWICVPDSTPEESVATLLIMKDIIFEQLEAQKELFDVRKKNKQVLKVHKLLGAEIYDETEEDFLFSLDPITYKNKKYNIIQLLNLI